MDTKRILYIGIGVAVVGGAAIWFHKRSVAAQQTQNDNTQTDAELAALMLQSPVSYSGGADSSASVSTPAVDTGSASLQSLISSILNPPATAPTPVTPTTTSPVTTAPTTPAPIAAPVSGNYQPPVINTHDIVVQPARWINLPLQTNVVQ